MPSNHLPAVAMSTLGWAGIVAGGLVAAVTDPLDVYRGSWVAAYLVLVVGVAQVVMGWARRGSGAGGAGTGWAQCAGWNLGSAGVIAGTLTKASLLVYVSSAALVVALIIAALGTRIAGKASGGGLWLLAYRAMLVILAVSIPVGMALSYLRHTG
ncbi:hypothetical protein [Dietzia timorensis]|nr:hypothetical protein [Dietzia timorensis]